MTTLLNAKSLRVDIDTLIKNPNQYKIIDVRSKKAYNRLHIKDALNLPVDLTYENKNINGKLTEPNKMQTILRDLGLDIDDKIAIYDNGTYFDAARVFWTLEVFGFKNVMLLNNGFKDWQLRKLPTSNKAPNVVKSKYITSINHNRLATKFTTQIATKNPNQVIIDARGSEAYTGKVSSAKRYGHIPKAVNIPAGHNIDQEDLTARLKSADGLKELYKDIDKSKKVVIYCAIGRISSTNYFALRELGYNVSNYDASWKEWGNDFNLPIRNRTKE
jgi:thiosulfate/3-mercaptopyruvate sulfurtransferase